MNTTLQLSRYVCICLLATLALAGCKTMPGATGSSTSKVPAWVLNPPPDNANELYGVGERSTLDQAKKAALAEIAGKLGTAIQADSTLTSRLNNNQTQESFVENIRSSVTSTEFSNFEVLQSEHGGDRYWVLVKVDRRDMAKNVGFKMDQMQKELDLDFSDYENYSMLNKARSGGELQKKLDDLKTQVMTMKAIDSGYDVTPVVNEIREREQAISQAKDKLEVRIEHDEDTKVFARQLEAQLTENKIKVTNGGSRSGKTVIAIKSDVQYFNVLQDFQAKLLVDIQAIDERGKVLATSNHNAAGYSRTSKRAALEQANLKLARQFTEEGLLESIGF